ncbi:hypothetical protein [Burkholderia anthina]|uniref:hypothetical protein n=1 Tax=Burkholderia anthina TaxID=179879 RepID=UPI000A762DBE|nr:hypothetical protein [Burkholderia anthina]
MATKRKSRKAPKRVPLPMSTPAKLAPKQLSFAFSFLRKGNGASDASTRFAIEHDKYAVWSACFFWVIDGLCSLADRGDVFNSIIKVINLGLFKAKIDKMKAESIGGRRAHFSEIHVWGGLVWE